MNATPAWTLSDREWSDIKPHAKLPDEARPSIEGAIIIFRSYRASEQRLPASAVVRDRLNKVAAAARVLASAIDQLSKHERFEMYTSDFLGPEFEEMPSERREAEIEGILNATLEQTKLIAEMCADVSEHQVSSKLYSKKYVVSRPADHMTDRLDAILAKYGCSPISRAKPAMNFLLAVFKVADVSVQSGAVDEAADRRVKRRGESTGTSLYRTPGDFPR
jgi:hypothetical protein